MLKTHKGMSKRVKRTKTGKLVHSKTCRRHLLTNKGRATKKGRYGKVIHEADMGRANALLPHG